MTHLLHIAHQAANEGVWTEPFKDALRQFGGLTILENGRDMPDEERAARIREADILVTGWGAASVPTSLAQDPGKLKYICHVTGGMRGQIPLEIIDAGIPVTNWGDAPANGVAEGAMALLLGAMKDLHERVDVIANGGWGLDTHTHGGSLEGLDVGIYGLGVIGRRFVEMLRPFGSKMRVFDPYIRDVPDDVEAVDSLEELFRASQAIVIHAGLTDETRGTVTADLLAILPRHGVVVNTARGGIIDMEALFKELESGRLRAGLDVTDPFEPLPETHPARKWPNVILTAHRIEHGWPDDYQPPRTLTKMQRYAVDNIRRHLTGEPLLWTMDRDRYLRST